MNFPVHFPSQLREHLRALRKARGLTQAALGKLLGVGQARIAEIENNPGVVSVDQLMKVLSALSVSMVLRDDSADGASDRFSPGARSLASESALLPKKKPVPQLDIKTPSGGQWRVEPLTSAGRYPPKSALVSRSDGTASSDAQAVRDANPTMDVAPTSRRNFVIRPKKGSW
ncbi:helix-turn-helix domain-containing protein [Acidovorax radicis]|uniref:helix-turn-helix domain-containing protein n=1 Tax=Acidovorax radicis TaxID=758826 RepID=UPI000495E4EA|nr:helix-turn-helix domain-containing protein [Acidovorax radicis]